MLKAPPAVPSSFDPAVPATGRAPAALAALLKGVIIAPLSDLAWIRITGEDRVRWLNGMVTNSIQALTPGQGCYNFFLNAQGRIQGDATAFLLEDSLLLETDRTQVAGLIDLLDRFIIMDDVELEAVESRAGLLVAGPGAASMLESLHLPGLKTHALQLVNTSWPDAPDGAPLNLIHAYSPIVPRFELWSDAATIASLAQALEHAGASNAAPHDLEDLRLLEGTPRYGRDIRDKELPQETAQVRALHFAKGCYLGQEIVERIRSRGNVHRTFIGFVLDGTWPEAGSGLFASDAPGKVIGELTSGASIDLPAGPKTLALGYIRRDVLDRGVSLTYSAGTATSAALPFPVGGTALPD